MTIVPPFIRLLRRFFSSDHGFYVSLFQMLGFYPNNLSLYKLAFRNKSAFPLENADVSENNERLEFLGDAILSAVTAYYLFKKFPYKDEGFLTELR